MSGRTAELDTSQRITISSFPKIFGKRFYYADNFIILFGKTLEVQDLAAMGSCLIGGGRGSGTPSKTRLN